MPGWRCRYWPAAGPAPTVIPGLGTLRTQPALAQADPSQAVCGAELAHSKAGANAKAVHAAVRPAEQG